MIKLLRNGILTLVTLLLAGTGCLDSGSSKDNFDYGDNDKNVVVAFGDSITEGRCAGDGEPWPSRLARLSGKRVVNSGVCGEKTEDSVNRIRGVLNRHKPGVVLILLGANDALFGRNPNGVIGNLERIVDTCLENNSRPLIATCLPLYPPRAFADPLAADYSERIRALAREKGIRLVDLRREFGDERSFLQSDGLHPSSSGNQLIALSFNDRLPK
ncbi:MAG TPA: GDSL-type esterase/lipase family protein [Kiritimatiellia bacterium]|nr:GDSL-type esterase/lipase family protein [Kiritimatiellia bacterium]